MSPQLKNKSQLLSSNRHNTALDYNPYTVGDVRPDSDYKRSQYTFFGPTYDDDIMREAANNIRDEWDNNNYYLVGNNCQDYADALRAEYNRIVRVRGLIR